MASDPSMGGSGNPDGANGNAFSLGELRAAMDSRVTNARNAMQRRRSSARRRKRGPKKLLNRG